MPTSVALRPEEVTEETWEKVASLLIAVGIVLVLAIFAVLLTGCAARYSSTDRHCDDGCWTLEPGPIDSHSWAWCRTEENTIRCIPAK
jgi:hypothetical protein